MVNIKKKHLDKVGVKAKTKTNAKTKAKTKAKIKTKAKAKAKSKAKIKTKAKAKANNAKGFTSRNYTRKAVELRKLDLDRDIEKEILGSLKHGLSKSMFKENIGRYANKRRIQLLLQKLLNYESNNSDYLHFDILDVNLQEILSQVTEYMIFTIADKKNHHWIRILGKIYNGLNEAYDQRNTDNFKNVRVAFKILVKLILDIEIDVNNNNFLESHELYELLIIPLIGPVD